MKSALYTGVSTKNKQQELEIRFDKFQALARGLTIATIRRACTKATAAPMLCQNLREAKCMSDTANKRVNDRRHSVPKAGDSGADEAGSASEPEQNPGYMTEEDLKRYEEALIEDFTKTYDPNAFDDATMDDSAELDPEDKLPACAATSEALNSHTPEAPRAHLKRKRRRSCSSNIRIGRARKRHARIKKTVPPAGSRPASRFGIQGTLDEVMTIISVRHAEEMAVGPCQVSQRVYRSAHEANGRSAGPQTQHLLDAAERLRTIGLSIDHICRKIEPAYTLWSTFQRREFRKSISDALRKRRKRGAGVQNTREIVRADKSP